MRALPAGWPAPSDPVQKVPKVYLHVLDGSWPPASTQDNEALPAGWTLTGSGSIDADLDAPLLPGQVNLSINPIEATASCTIPQPEGHHLAPWKFGPDRTPTVGKVELIASHDGYNGSTAFLLGQFLLDPMKGQASAGFLSLSLTQDIVRLNKRHDLFNTPANGGTSPTDWLIDGATKNGYTLSATAPFAATLGPLYFPGKTSELEAFQQIVRANLGSMFLSFDGVTLKVLDPDYLLGAGTVNETLTVLDNFDDLPWSQDVNAAVDRIELTYLPPSIDDTDPGDGATPAAYQGAPVWFAPKGARLAAGASRTYRFDPGSAATVLLTGHGGDTTVFGNAAKDGTGGTVDLPAAIDADSSGAWSVTITNDTGITRYLVAPYRPPTTGSYPTFYYPKGTRSFLAGTIDGTSPDNGGRTLTWGVAAEDAVNVLTFDLGRCIQTTADAQAILARIVDRVSSPTYVIDDVRVVPNAGRELGDLQLLSLPGLEFNTRALVTGTKLSWVASDSEHRLEQSLTIAAMPLRISDFNAAWNAAFGGAPTIADFNTVWAGKTIDDFNRDPLRTAP